jgi:hypothetical protein
MKGQLIYVELKSGYSDNGPAWIGIAGASKSGSTIYFNGQAFKSLKGSGISSNYYDVKTGNEYWISGVKKKGDNRHWAGSGKITIDKGAVQAYLKVTEQSDLPKTFIEATLEPSKAKHEFHDIENEKESEYDSNDLGRPNIKKTLGKHE